MVLLRHDKKNEKWLNDEAADIYKDWKKRNKSFRYRDIEFEDLPVDMRIKFRQLAINVRKKEGSLGSEQQAKAHVKESLQQIYGKTHGIDGIR